MTLTAVTNCFNLEVLSLAPHSNPDLSLFYFTLEAKDSLLTNPFNQLVEFSSHKLINYYSVTLPFHGQGIPNLKTVDKWREECTKGSDFLIQFLSQCHEIILELERKGKLSREKTLLAGLSRGAFIAANLASQDSNFPGVMAFAPMTRMFSSEEKKSLENQGLFQDFWELPHLVPKLFRKKIFISIGNHDQKVSTQSCLNFYNALVETAIHNKLRPIALTLQVYPAVGHKGHGTPPEIFQLGADWINRNFHL